MQDIKLGNANIINSSLDRSNNHIYKIMKRHVTGCVTVLKAQKPSGKFSHSTSGQKHCRICDIFMNRTGSRCPCFGYVLRISQEMNTKDIHSTTIRILQRRFTVKLYIFQE
jgi:hypothetical protein